MACSSLLRPPAITPPMYSSSPSPTTWRRPPSIFSISQPRFSSITIRSSSTVRDYFNREISPAPWLMLPPTFEGGDTLYNFYNLAKKKKVVELMGSGDGVITEVVGSTQGFLALFDKRKNELFLYNPISQRCLELPSIHTLPLGDIGSSPADLAVTKVMMSDDESRAMMIFGPSNRLAFCCPGHSTEWTPIGAHFFEKKWRSYARVYGDIVYSKKDKMFTCCTDHDMEEWDLRLSRAGQQVNLMYQVEFESEKQKLPSWWYDDIECEKETYLVLHEHKDELFDEDTNQLYVVHRYIMEREEYLKNWDKLKYEFPTRDWDDRYPHKTIGFDVYKADRVGVNRLQLKYMEKGLLDNLIMFLGRNHSFALRAEDYPELKHGSIYFTDNPRHTPLDWQTYGEGAHDTGIYCFYDRSFHPIFDYEQNEDDDVNVSSIKGIVPPPIWFTPSPKPLKLASER